MSRAFVFATLLLLLAPNSQADNSAAAPGDAPKVLAPANDLGLSNDGKLSDLESYEVRIGELNNGGECYVLPFRLPALGAGQHFASVHLRMQMLAKSAEKTGVLGNADLYGIGVRDSAKLLPTDYYQGPNPDPKATLIQANLLTPDSKQRVDAETGPFIETSTEGDAALVKYFNDSAQPGTAGKYLFLRISYDVDPIPPGNNAYIILTSAADGDEEAPILTYTIK